MNKPAFVLSCLALAAVWGCADDRVYIGDGRLYQVAMTASTAPLVEGEEGNLYLVETRATLPIRQPLDQDIQDRYDGASAYPNLPFPRLPWIERGDVELTVDFTLANLDKTTHEVDVIVNGANEFDEYVPGFIEVEENPVPLHSQWERRYTLKAKERLSRTIREEELDEAAVDLATVVNGAPNSDEVVYFENKSTSDERSRKYIPAVIPGLGALRVGLRATGTTAPKVLLEATVRARDVGDKLASGDEPHMHLQPEEFMPILPE